MKLSSIFKLRKWARLVATSRFSHFLSDRRHIKLIAYVTNLDINLDNPKTYNDKLQWLKLHDRKPEYTTMVDKYAAKDYIASKIGSEHIIPTLGVWKKFKDIDFDSLPNQFVLKSTHDCGGLVICKDKSKLDKREAKEKIERCLKRNYFWNGREWPYKNVKPRIIAEKYMKDDKTDWLVDYKFFCFNGEPKFMYCSMDKADDPRTDFFDMDYNRLDMRMRDPNSEIPPPKPEKFEEMKALAKILCKDIPHIRVDFYQVNNQVYAGELTFYHMGGFTKIYPEKWMDILGDWIKLPSKQDK